MCAAPFGPFHLVLAAENVRQDYVLPAPDVDESTDVGGFRLLNLPALVRMRLTSFRRKDQAHLLDMIDAGLIDQPWCQQVPAELAARLQEVTRQSCRIAGNSERRTQTAES